MKATVLARKSVEPISHATSHVSAWCVHSAVSACCFRLAQSETYHIPLHNRRPTTFHCKIGDLPYSIQAYLIPIARPLLTRFVTGDSCLIVILFCTYQLKIPSRLCSILSELISTEQYDCETAIATDSSEKFRPQRPSNTGCR